MRRSTFAEQADRELALLAELDAAIAKRSAELDRIHAQLDAYPARCTDRLLANVYADDHSHAMLPEAHTVLGPGGDFTREYCQ